VNALKPLILLTIMGGVGFFVYRSLNKAPSEPPPGTDTSVTASPEIKLGDASRSKNLPTADGANLLRPSHDSVAPGFNSSGSRSNTGSDAPPFSAAPVDSTAAQPSSPLNAAPSSEPASQAAPAETASQAVSGLDQAHAPPNANGANSNAQVQDRSQSFAVAWGAIQPKLASGQFSEALEDLTVWRNHPSLAPEERNRVETLLNQLAGTVIYSREHLLAAPYVVKPGDQLEQIAETYKVTPELLAKINGIDPVRPLEPGAQLKVVPGPFSAVVEAGADRLTLLLNGRYAGSFPVADWGSAVAERAHSGAPMELTISQKTTAPIYNGPQGEMQAGDPANPLGDRLMTLGGEFAIHGTNPQAAPQVQQPSAGIRMNANDMGELYDILTVGSRVILRK
jgi:LysM repeat protein